MDRLRRRSDRSHRSRGRRQVLHGLAPGGARSVRQRVFCRGATERGWTPTTQPEFLLAGSFWGWVSRAARGLFAAFGLNARGGPFFWPPAIKLRCVSFVAFVPSVRVQCCSLLCRTGRSEVRRLRQECLNALSSCKVPCAPKPPKPNLKLLPQRTLTAFRVPSGLAALF